MAREPWPFEVYESGVLLHGTKADLAAENLLVPGCESNFAAGRRSNYVYLTATLDAATWGAELAAGEGRGWQPAPALERGARHPGRQRQGLPGPGGLA